MGGGGIETLQGKHRFYGYRLSLGSHGEVNDYEKLKYHSSLMAMCVCKRVHKTEICNISMEPYQQTIIVHRN